MHGGHEIASQALSDSRAAGGLAIVLGAVALLVKKGGIVHRRSRLRFVCAMIVLVASASILVFRKSRTDRNVAAVHDDVRRRQATRDE